MGAARDKGSSHGSTLERIEGELSSTAGHLAGAALSHGCQSEVQTLNTDVSWPCAARPSVREHYRPKGQIKRRKLRMRS